MSEYVRGGACLHVGQRNGDLHVTDREVALLAVQAALEPVVVHFLDQRDHVVLLKKEILVNNSVTRALGGCDRYPCELLVVMSKRLTLMSIAYLEF